MKNQRLLLRLRDIGRKYHATVRDGYDFAVILAYSLEMKREILKACRGIAGLVEVRPDSGYIAVYDPTGE